MRNGVILTRCDEEGEKMVNEHEILEKLKRAIETWDPKMAHSATMEALDAGMEPRVIIENGLGRGMVTISNQFDEAKIYLPQVLAASNAMDAAMNVLAPKMTGSNAFTKGTIVIGTVHGDIHEIGKKRRGSDASRIWIQCDRSRKGCGPRKVRRSGRTDEGETDRCIGTYDDHDGGSKDYRRTARGKFDGGRDQDHIRWRPGQQGVGGEHRGERVLS